MMNPAAAGGDGGDAGAWTATVTHQESYCPVPLTVRGTQTLVSFAPLCPVPLTVRGRGQGPRLLNARHP